MKKDLSELSEEELQAALDQEQAAPPTALATMSEDELKSELAKSQKAPPLADEYQAPKIPDLKSEYARPDLAAEYESGPTKVYGTRFGAAKLGGPLPEIRDVEGAVSGVRQLAAGTARVGGPVLGAILGTPADVATGPAGTITGAVLGAGAGEELAQLIEGKDTLSKENLRRAGGAMLTAPLMVGTPMAMAPAARPLVNLVRQATYGAGVGAASTAAYDVATEGETSAEHVLTGGGMGLLLGLLAGGLQNADRRGKAFDIARQMGFKGSTEAELKTWAEEQTVARAKPVVEAEATTTAEPAAVVPRLTDEYSPAVPAGDELLRRAEAAGMRPPIEVPIVQGSDSGAGSAPNTGSGVETAPIPALAVVADLPAVNKMSLQDLAKELKSYGISPRSRGYLPRYEINKWVENERAARLAPEPTGESSVGPTPGLEVPSSGSAPAVIAPEGEATGGGQASQEIVLPPQSVKRGVARSVGMAPDGAPDLLTDIEESGGIGTPKETSGGEYDGYSATFGTGIARLLRRRGASQVDQLVGELNGTGRYNFKSIDEFYQAVNKAADGRLKLTNELQGMEHEQKLATTLFTNKGRALELKARKSGSADTLNVGDAFAVRGEPMKVIGIDPDTMAVIVENGARLEIPAGSEVYPDKGRVKRVKKVETDGPFEDATPYVTAHTRYRQLRQAEQAGALDPAGHTELDQVEKTLGQDFFAHYEGTAGQGGPSEAEQKALRQARLKAGREAPLQGGELTSQVDMFGPTTDKEGQFSLFENAANKYLDARQVANPVARAAVRGILAGVWERQMERQLQLQLGTDAKLADDLLAIRAGSSRPVAAPGQLGTAFGERPQGVAESGGVGGAGALRLVATNVTNQFVRDGYLKLIGRAFESIQDFVAAAQILRNAAVETFWLLPFDKESRLLAPFAMTSRMPASVVMGSEIHQELNAHLKAVGADSWRVLHNHPSGHINPSTADLEFTKHLAEKVRAAKFIDHIVINHGSYAVIDRWGIPRQSFIPDIFGTPDPLRASGSTNPYLSRRIETPEALVRLGYELQHPEGNVLLNLLGSKADIRGIASVSLADLTAPDFGDRLREMGRNVGATHTVAYTENPSIETQAAIARLQQSELITQAAYKTDTGVALTANTFKHGALFGQTADKNTLLRLAEEQADYLADDEPLAAHNDAMGEVVPVKLANMDKVPVVEMPELVQIVKELSGQIPKIKNLPRYGGYMRGEGRGLVVLNRRLFNDPVYMAQILAHELGHLIDYLPAQTLKRGNLLGRLASLRSFLSNQFGPAAANNKELRTELLALDKWWSPWDEATSPEWYKAYRKSAKELYAQALSVMFNAPHELKARAPRFWEEFFRFIDRKPEVKAELFATWDLIHQGAKSVSAARVKDLRTGYARAEEILLDKVAERAGRRNSLEASIENWKQKHFDLYAPIIDKARAAKAAGAALPWHHDPEYVFDAHPLAENANHRFLDRLQKTVLNPLDGAGLDDTALGDYLFFNRIMHEAYRVGDAVSGRTVIANPLGHTPATARRELLTMRYRLGPHRMESLKAAAKQFQDLVFEVVERGHAAGIYSTENYLRAKANRYNYATFAVVDYLEQSPHIPAGIRQQRGTLKDVANPFTATVLKMLTANKLAEHNQAKRVAVQLLTKHFPAEIDQAPVTKIPLASGKMMYRSKPPPMGKHELMVLTDGRPVTWHVERPIAQMFEMRTPASSHSLVGVLNWTFRNLFYPTFLTYNPAFQLWMNPIRDLRRSYVNLPAGVKRRHYIGEQIRKNVTARARLLNDVQQADLVRRRTLRALGQQRPLAPAEADELRTLDLRALSIELLATRAISTPFEAFAHNPARDDVWGKMLQDYKLMPTEGQGSFLREYILGKVGLGPLADKLDKAGMILEAMPKAGGYYVLTRDLGWSAGEAAQFVRNHVGTPNYLRRGQWASVDGTVFPFINIFMQGFAGDLRQATGQALGPVDPRKQKFEWWRRMAEGTLLPRLLQALAAAGVLGAGLKKLYDAVSDYNKTNYMVLPLGETTGGDNGYKTVALRLPEDETARVLGGLIHYSVQMALNNDPAAKSNLTDLVNVMGGNLPGVNPIVSLADGWRHYAAGVNPRDGLRGNTVMSSTQFNAGGWPRLQGMFAFSWEQVGGANFVRWDRNANTTAEMVLGATPLLNRSLMITDAGLRERQEQANINFDQRNAQIRAALPDNVNRLLGEYNRLMALRPETRTPPQQFRLKELSLWNSKIWTPTYRQMQEIESKDWKSLGNAVGEMSKAFEKP